MSDAVRRRRRAAVAGHHALALVAGLGACALSLPEARRPALVLAVLGGAAVVAALVTGWRVAGSLAVVLVGATPLMAGALEEDASSTGRLAAATLLVLLLVVALDGVERRGRADEALAVLRTAAPAQRWGGPLLALLASAAMAAVAAAPATPSVGLVLVGLLAGVAAVLLATRLH